MSKKNAKPGFKKFGWILFAIILIAVVTYFLLPAKTKTRLHNSVGISYEEASGDEKVDEDFVVIRSISSRNALIGDRQVITGKLYNTHDSLSFTNIKLRFDFSDGIETVTYNFKLRPKNSGKKFKEKFEGHKEDSFQKVVVTSVDRLK